MNIEVYTICYNEEFLLPFFLNHYTSHIKANKIVIYDNHSTDKSVEIAKSFNKCEVEVIPYDTNNTLDDNRYLEIKNNCWKNSKADWVIICDIDELIYIKDFNLLYDENVNIYKPKGFQMISDTLPDINKGLLTDQITYGSPDIKYSKCAIFRPKIANINYDHGAHTCKPSQPITPTADILLLHYKYINYEYVVNNFKNRFDRLSRNNIRHGYGGHYGFSEEKIKEIFNDLNKNKYSFLKTGVSFSITSCSRLDLLDTTINSFLKYNTYPIDEYIMTDDSGDKKIYDTLVSKYGDKFKIIRNNPKVGLAKSIDILYNNCNNEYIFHCEDDWLFNDNNSTFIEESLSILENKNIHQVWLRDIDDLPEIYSDLGKSNLYKGIEYYDIPTIGNWCGYSYNPGLRRKSDYHRFFHKGVSSIGDEQTCSVHLKQFNYKSVLLKNTCCKHIGYENKTKNFKH